MLCPSDATICCHYVLYHTYVERVRISSMATAPLGGKQLLLTGQKTSWWCISACLSGVLLEEHSSCTTVC